LSGTVRDSSASQTLAGIRVTLVECPNTGLAADTNAHGHLKSLQICGTRRPGSTFTPTFLSRFAALESKRFSSLL
jgi:hypothetical protein